MKIILHVDGDAFFASCEVASRPWLKGKPVVTGKERGIASSMSYEAKALGISRAMSISEIRRHYPQVTVLPSDYDTYSIYAHRMYAIVRRYTPFVEEYSIDECFADLTDVIEDEINRKKIDRKSADSTVAAKMVAALDIATRIKYDLDHELGITFSVGVSVNKVLAKTASKWKKPSGLIRIAPDEIDVYLKSVPIHKIWGIGRSISVELAKAGIVTAYDLAHRDTEWVSQRFAKPVQLIHAELCGHCVMSVCGHDGDDQKSISRTGTFSKATTDRVFIFAHISRNIEQACSQLRQLGFLAGRISFFIKTKDFQYYSGEFTLPRPACEPSVIIKNVHERLIKLLTAHDPMTIYRATGVTLSMFTPKEMLSGNIFAVSDLGSPDFKTTDPKQTDSTDSAILYRSLDRLDKKYGKKIVFLGSSLSATKHDASLKRLAIPSLGFCT